MTLLRIKRKRYNTMATKKTFDAEEEQKRQPAVNNTTPAVDMQLVETMKQQANQEYQASNPTPAKPTLKTDPVDNIQREIDKTYQSGIDAVNKQAEAYKQQQVHLYDVAKGFKDELEAEREKDSRLRGQENVRNIFGATGELVASLANLYQVGKGAPNAQMHPFAQDWMKEVDKKRKERKTSIDNIRERQREAESKLNALKAEQDANLASARLAVEQNRAKQQIAYEQQKAEQAIAEQARREKNAQQQWENEYQAERDRVKDAQFAQTLAQDKEENARLAAQQGYVKDEKTGSYKYVGKGGNANTNVKVLRDKKGNTYKISDDVFDKNVAKNLAKELGMSYYDDEELYEGIQNAILEGDDKFLDSLKKRGYIENAPIQVPITYATTQPVTQGYGYVPKVKGSEEFRLTTTESGGATQSVHNKYFVE